jgi:hypothetical protein
MFCFFMDRCASHQLVVLQYFVGVQLISFLIFAPWLLVTNRYDTAFQSQYRLVSKAWYGSVQVTSADILTTVLSRFSLFLVTSAYTGTGLSLIDTYASDVVHPADFCFDAGSQLDVAIPASISHDL